MVDEKTRGNLPPDYEDLERQRIHQGIPETKISRRATKAGYLQDSDQTSSIRRNAEGSP